MNKIVGIALIIIGAGVAIWGFQISDSVGEQLTQTVTGSHSDKVMMMFIGGAVSFAIGLYLFKKK